MKKTIISLAVAAGMAASSAAIAAPTVYGLMNISIDSPDTGTVTTTPDITVATPVFTDGHNTDSMEMKSQTSAIGLKGSEDLGDGMKAFYKAEFQFNADEAAGLTGRDQYIGLKGGMGTVKFGAMATNYKQKGSSVDPMFRTSLEGRGAMQMQSSLHGGSGTRTSGRVAEAVQYSSPKMGGMQLVINTTFAGDDTAGTVSINQEATDIDETIGVGFRYAAKAFSVYFDMIDLSYDDTQGTDLTDVVGSESATKIGGTYKMGPVKLGIQLEQSEKLTGHDYTMISANYTMDKNNSVYVAIGQKGDYYYDDGTTTESLSDTGSTSFAIMYDHKMSKATNLYVGYGSRSDDEYALTDFEDALAGNPATVTDGYSVLTAGMRVKF